MPLVFIDLYRSSDDRRSVDAGTLALMASWSALSRSSGEKGTNELLISACRCGEHSKFHLYSEHDDTPPHMINDGMNIIYLRCIDTGRQEEETRRLSEYYRLAECLQSHDFLMLYSVYVPFVHQAWLNIRHSLVLKHQA